MCEREEASWQGQVWRQAVGTKYVHIKTLTQSQQWKADDAGGMAAPSTSREDTRHLKIHVTSLEGIRALDCYVARSQAQNGETTVHRCTFVMSFNGHVSLRHVKHFRLCGI
jgi:hypothetical protein